MLLGSLWGELRFAGRTFLNTLMAVNWESRAMKLHLLVSAVSMMTLSACANLSPLTRSTQLKDGNYWLTYDSSRRGAYVYKGEDGKLHSCAEPAPDTGYNFTNGLKGKTTTASGTSAEAEANLTATLLALEGRDNLVLISREALYRICEMRANGDIPTDKVYPAFQEVMFAIKEIAKFRQEKAKADQEASKAITAQANLETARTNAAK